MSSVFKKVWKNRWILRSLFHSIYFNFHYLPWKQAIHLPILLYKPKLICCKGSVSIDAKEIKMGMILLGRNCVSRYPNSGIIYGNCGGKIIFHGKCFIGNNSALSIGGKGYVEFGNNFSVSATFDLVAFHSISFGDNVGVGWECLFMDTDGHKMTKVAGGYSKGYGSIKIGKNNWIGGKTTVLKHTQTPDFCVVSMGSLLNKKYEFPPYSVIGLSSEMEIKRQGVWRNKFDDVIEYEYARPQDECQ